jgi:hypothetical protein
MATIEFGAGSTDAAVTLKRIVQTTLLAWLGVIGLDFFLNAGILAHFYDWNLPSLLPPARMFAYIPLGYAAFLLWCILLAWLMVRTGTVGFSHGTTFGAEVGALYGASTFLAAMSLYTFPVRMVLCWSLDYFLVFTLAGAVIGAGLKAPKLRTVAYRVIAFVIVCLVLTVVLQTLGWAPAPKLAGPVPTTR